MLGRCAATASTASLPQRAFHQHAWVDGEVLGLFVEAWRRCPASDEIFEHYLHGLGACSMLASVPASTRDNFTTLAADARCLWRASWRSSGFQTAWWPRSRLCSAFRCTVDQPRHGASTEAIGRRGRRSRERGGGAWGSPPLRRKTQPPFWTLWQQHAKQTLVGCEDAVDVKSMIVY